MKTISKPASISAPPPDIDQKAVLEDREKMTKVSPEYIEGTKQIAQAQTGTERGAAGWIAPAGKGLAGLMAGAAGLRLAGAAGKAVASVAPQFAKDAANVVSDGLKKLFSPASRGPEAYAVGGLMREGQAVKEREFQQAAENLRGFGQAVGTLSPQEKLAIIDLYQTGSIPAAARQGLRPEFQQLAGEIKTLFDDRWQKMTRLGIEPANFVENYMSQIWKNRGLPTAPGAPSATPPLGGGSSLEGGKAFTKQRSFLTYREGIAAGRQPVTDNPIEIALLGLHGMDKYIMAHEVMQEAESAGYGSWVQAGQRSPQDSVPINDKIARKGGATFYMPEQAATIINRTLGPGAEALMGENLFNAIRTSGNVMNQAQLSLSGFHAMFVIADAMASRSALGVQQISRGKAPEVGRGLMRILTGPAGPVISMAKGMKGVRQYLGTGNYGPDMERIIDAYTAGGGKIRMDQFMQSGASGSFWQSFRGSLQKMRGQPGRATFTQDLDQMISDAGRPTGFGATVKVAAKMIPRIMNTVMAPLMEFAVPRMKMGVAMEMISDALRINPNMTREELRAVTGQIIDSVDNRLGQLNYDNLYWNKMMRDLAHIGTRALGWNVGTLREGAGGVLDIAKGRQRQPGGMKQLSARAGYVLALPITSAVIGGMYQYLKTGQGPQELTDYYFPKTGGKNAHGGDMRASMPGYIKDYYEWTMQPEQTAIGKLHPMLSSTIAMLNNKQWLTLQGQAPAIRDPRSPPGQQVKDFSDWMLREFTPIGMQARAGTENSNISGFERYLGIREAPLNIMEPKRAEKDEKREISRSVKLLNRQKYQLKKSQEEGP